MNRLNTLISNMLNSIPLPSLRGRGRGWGFYYLIRKSSTFKSYHSPPCGGGAGGGLFSFLTSSISPTLPPEA